MKFFKSIPSYMIMVVIVFMSITFSPCAVAAPVVSQVTVTDVTPASFSVIWASSEASTCSLNVFDDQAGTVPTQGITLELHPVESGNTAIKTQAEDNGVMKVRVTGLLPNTHYYFQTVTTSKSTSEVTYFPATAPMLPVTTATGIVRTKMAGGNKIPFTNDLIMFDCYLTDGVTPAEGTLLVVETPGANYPISGFVGDGVPIPQAYVDLNNLFNTQTSKNLPLYGGEQLTLTKFMGIAGTETADYYVPVNNQLAEIKYPPSIPPCEGDFDIDGDVDGGDLAKFAADFGRTDCTGDCLGDFDIDGDVDGRDLAKFAADFGRTDCPF